MEVAKDLAKKQAKKVALGIFLKFILPFLLVAGLVFGIIFLLLAVMGGTMEHKGGLDGGEAVNLSQEVLAHKPTVEKYAAEYGVEEYVGVILALMMQESGGKGDDPMQASESLCGSVGCITDPEVSIEQGVKYFSQVIESAKGDVKLALQSYNFGGGFIDFVMDNGGSYTQDLAIEFSSMKYEELKHTGIYSCVRPEAIPFGACYGDIYYVDAVLKYYDYTIAVDGEFALPVSGGNMTSDYGWRSDPHTGERSMHKGIDFGCVNHVTPIYAAEGGTVEYAQFHTNSNGSPGYGNLVMIKHGEGLITAYAHMSSLSVNEGDTVKKGQKVGVCGSTGSSTGPHLHLETKSGLWDGHMDPSTIIDFGAGEL
ncbi:lysozyme family protein [Virgibacillus salexigens]|uniref:lysozyme family protein n=1 Tax=Virgibacillus massiliensis TaxID=1462526 RepID=UPI00136B59F9|nr:lysozyme family protein [Virgibacillus massiliensis]MYL43895.1 peptidoglycan DD-metalloendopeptidase family protein [Virgibacillus massiliensis]